MAPGMWPTARGEEAVTASERSARGAPPALVRTSCAQPPDSCPARRRAHSWRAARHTSSALFASPTLFVLCVRPHIDDGSALGGGGGRLRGRERGRERVGRHHEHSSDSDREQAAASAAASAAVKASAAARQGTWAGVTKVTPDFFRVVLIISQACRGRRERARGRGSSFEQRSFAGGARQGRGWANVQRPPQATRALSYSAPWATWAACPAPPRRSSSRHGRARPAPHAAAALAACEEQAAAGQSGGGEWEQATCRRRLAACSTAARSACLLTAATGSWGGAGPR